MQQGFYTDPPSRRMAIDGDGTQVYRLDGSNTLTQAANSDIRILSSESDNSSSFFFAEQQTTYGYLVIIFPELRDITHIYLSQYPTAFSVGINTTVQWSTNTTNGLDGTWTTAANITSPVESVKPNFRERLTTLSLGAVKALRIYYGGVQVVQRLWINKVHIYGHISAGQTPHRIDYCFTDGSELGIDLDYGDQPRDSDRVWSPIEGFNEDTPLYLRNRSPDKVAQDVHLTIEALSDGMASDTTMSKDNNTFSSQLTWTSIQPQEIIGPVYVKHSTQLTETLGLRAARLKIAVGSWF